MSLKDNFHSIPPNLFNDLYSIMANVQCEFLVQNLSTWRRHWLCYIDCMCNVNDNDEKYEEKREWRGIKRKKRNQGDEAKSSSNQVRTS